MFGHIHQWGSLGLEFFCEKAFNYRFNFLNRYRALLVICPFELGLVICVFQGICPLHLRCQIYWPTFKDHLNTLLLYKNVYHFWSLWPPFLLARWFISFNNVFKEPVLVYCFSLSFCLFILVSISLIYA